MDTEISKPEIKETVEFKSLAEAKDAFVELKEASDAIFNEATDTNKALANTISELKAELADLGIQLEAKNSEINLLSSKVEELEAKDFDADKRAAVIAASVGVDAVESLQDEVEEEMPIEDRKAEYNKLTDLKAKREYFNKYLKGN